MIQYTDIVSTEVEAKLSASIEVSHWLASVLSAATCRFVNSNAVLLAATSLSCLLGTIVYYYSKVVSKNSTSTPEIATIETSKIEPTPITIEKPTESANSKEDDFPDIDLVPTDDIESDTDGSEQDDQDDWNEETYKEIFSDPISNYVVSDNDGNDADSSSTRSSTSEDDENDDQGDWNEEEYKKKFPSPKPVVKRRSTTKTAKDTTTTATTSTRSKPAAKKKETLAQMRKRVAREMKESEERKRQTSKKPARWAPTKKPVRKETVAEMKARVAREFAAKLKK
eukprot:CAMPEP_0116153556 /NCGR_PEP_ID=MMETSP0329-20121206/21311_1 /TAXON_ID=697910 /ORGANISM="Pseudo-nitzschia arenysensis, Strain B593" /LENGTH=282 /DNA_ID=CAMNT_0003650479 /DNA_START=105 /DNA_END=953 /DNA_ORIENTATION=-